MPVSRWIRSLELSATLARTQLTVLAQETTLETVLRDALLKQRLEFREQGGHLRVALPKADERGEFDCDVSDLVSGTEATAIAKLIEQFVAPNSWQSAKGQGTIEAKGTMLHIEQSEANR